MKKIIVVDKPARWPLDPGDIELVSAKMYLEDSQFTRFKKLRVFNLCNDYAYQTKGYYVSLMAEARGHIAVPSMKNILDLKGNTVIKSISDELEDLIQNSLKQLKSGEFILSVYFGYNVANKYHRLANELQKLFQAPFLRARFVKNKKWELKGVRPIPYREIPGHHLPYVHEFAQIFFNRKRYNRAKNEKYLYDLAILVNPKEHAPPSDEKALDKFEEAARKLGCYVDFITKDDYNRIGQYDAMFLRATTSVNHFTYRFARRSQAEGLAVIDSPEAILKCANKVYLTETLNVGKVPIPKTHIVAGHNLRAIERQIDFPCVLKLPDSSFSMGVVKVENHDELHRQVKVMLRQSELLLVQEYTPTQFDWRIGILDGEILFACKYYMAQDHWQIYNWESKEEANISGDFENVPLEKVPRSVAEMALKATRLIGGGLFGVDLKEVNGQPLLIEVNDNPNIDFGVEDIQLGDLLYEKIIRSLLSQVNAI